LVNISTSGKMIGKYCASIILANHLHNILGTVLPIPLSRENSITQTVIDFFHPWFNFSNSSIAFGFLLIRLRNLNWQLSRYL
jgi:hypothetical protein